VGCTAETAAAGNYCHVDLTTNANFATALAQAIQAIAKQVISCTYQVPPPPDGRLIDPLKIAITYTTGSGEVRELRRASNSGCTDGQWYVSAVDGTGVPTDLALCPDSCDAVSGDSGASVLVTFACNERL
jgi:acetylornithine deacetylase/succinyl-diaminopimelate desuccinylase-like protein